MEKKVGKSGMERLKRTLSISGAFCRSIKVRIGSFDILPSDKIQGLVAPGNSITITVDGCPATVFSSTCCMSPLDRSHRNFWNPPDCQYYGLELRLLAIKQRIRLLDMELRSVEVVVKMPPAIAWGATIEIQVLPEWHESELKVSSTLFS